MTLTPAPDGYPIKIIRDATTEIIGDIGILMYKHLPEDEIHYWLKMKLMEEATEYLLKPEVDELSDVIAVVEGLAAIHKMTLNELIRVLDDDPRGGFFTGRMMLGYHPEFDGKGNQ